MTSFLLYASVTRSIRLSPLLNQGPFAVHILLLCEPDARLLANAQVIYAHTA
jgi:hypothetical protein